MIIEIIFLIIAIELGVIAWVQWFPRNPWENIKLAKSKSRIKSVGEVTEKIELPKFDYPAVKANIRVTKTTEKK